MNIGYGMSGIGLFILHQQALEQKPGSKPAGCVVEADDFGEIPAGSLVIPRAQIAFPKPQAGQKFSGEDHTGVNQTTEYEVVSAHQAGKRGEQGGESVYGEHPDGGRAGQAEISSAKSVEGGEDHLQKPSQKPTVYIVVNKFFHIN